MKALISPNESFSLTWISSWNNDEPVYSEILDCLRIAEISSTPFEVAQPLFWIDCSDECKADEWYYKDGVCYIKPEDTPKPEQSE